ncbi:MAG: sterol desaturase family protein [Candidatus Dormibacteraeota bacterium]|nr:sterol desaturase family protein [Candidatus Dormibacteraeota bacterium]
MDSAAARPVQRRGSASGTKRLTLAAMGRPFFRHGSPRIMAVIATGAVAARIVLGRWTWVDLVVFFGILLLQPFVEWVLHVFGLHMKPRNVFGRRIDPLFARRHRMHHRDPRNVPLVFVPLPVLAGLVASLAAIAYFAAPQWPMKLTVFATTTLFLFAYEWTHYLIHSPYIPRTAVFRVVWRNHILHHYKNEQYWFGVTNPLGDVVLRTNPRKDTVAQSPTARTLGVDDENALLRPAAV